MNGTRQDREVALLFLKGDWYMLRVSNTGERNEQREMEKGTGETSLYFPPHLYLLRRPWLARSNRSRKFYAH